MFQGKICFSYFPVHVVVSYVFISNTRPTTSSQGFIRFCFCRTQSSHLLRWVNEGSLSFCAYHLEEIRGRAIHTLIPQMSLSNAFIQDWATLKRDNHKEEANWRRQMRRESCQPGDPEQSGGSEVSQAAMEGRQATEVIVKIFSFFCILNFQENPSCQHFMNFEKTKV